jgi:hypothetical protein
MSYQHKCNAQLTIPTETARKPPQQTKKRGAATIETAPGEFAKDSFGDTLRTTSRSTPRRKPQTSKNTAPEQPKTAPNPQITGLQNRKRLLSTELHVKIENGVWVAWHATPLKNFGGGVCGGLHVFAGRVGLGAPSGMGATSVLRVGRVGLCGVFLAPLSLVCRRHSLHRLDVRIECARWRESLAF